MTHVETTSHVSRGQTKIVTVLAKDSAGTLTDPTTLTAYVRKPNGTPTSYIYGTDNEWAKTSTGTFTFTFTLDTGSRAPWEVRFVSETSGVQAVKIHRFNVSEDPFA